MYKWRSVGSVGNCPCAIGRFNQYRPVLLRLEAVGPNRVVFGYKASPLAGKPKLVADEVQILTEQIAGGEWRKITPQQPLANGEYALSFMVEGGSGVSLDVYDFGVGPAAPTKKP